MVMPITTDGEMRRCGNISMKGLALEIMFPQVGVGGWAPRPRNDRPLSTRMASPRLSETWTRIGAITFGRIAVLRMRASLDPMTRDACTYSASLTCNVDP